MDREKKARLITLFFSVLKLSACTFGGGFVIVPLMRKRFVEELGWIDEQEMLDMIAIAQSSPGAIAVNAAILVGQRAVGIAGALVSVLGTVIPPVAIISVISLFYKAFRDNAAIGFIMLGMLCGVAAVIFDVVTDMVKAVVKKKQLMPIFVLLGAFVAVRFFSVSIVPVILACGIIGAVDTLFRERRQKRGKAQ